MSKKKKVNKTKPNETWNRFVIRKQFKFEGAHQLFTSFSECCNQQIHGHSYVVDVFFMSNKLNKDGMVIDFGEIKSKINKYMNSWDHAIVMPRMFPKEYIDMLKKHNKKIMIVDYNPTAENMAKYMYEYISDKIPETLKVRVSETATGFAEYCEGF